MLALFLIVSSFVVEGAVGDRLKGMTAIRGISVPVLVINTLIAGLFIYIVMALIGGKFFNAKSRTGRTVFFIVVIFFAIAIAFKVGNQFIWQEEVSIQPAIRFLFGIDSKGRIGILRPSRILIFIGASALLSWMFIQTVKIGQGTNTKVDIVVATILAAGMTHEGLTTGMLIKGGQIIAIWIFYRQFKGEGEGRKWGALIWAFGLVLWITTVAFPGRGWLGPWMLSVVERFGYFGFVVLFLGGGLLLWLLMKFVGGREKKADEEKKERRWKEDIVAYPVAALLRWLGKSRNPVVRAIYKLWDPNITTPEGKIPFPFREMRTEFMTLMNYMLRMEVYYAKKNEVTKTQEFLDEEIYSEKGLHQIFEIDKINSNLNLLKNGGGFKLNSQGMFEPIPVVVLKDDGSEEEVKTGWNSTEWFIYKLINLLKESLENFSSIGPEQYRDVESHLDGELETIDGSLRAFKKRWGGEDFKGGGFTKRKGAYHVLESKRLYLLDQYRRHGRYDHTYRFANVGARIYKVAPVWPLGKNESNSEKWKKPNLHVPANQIGVVKKGDKYKIEVDGDGYFISDLNEWIVEGKKGENNQGYIRKVNPGVEIVVVGGKRVRIKGLTEYNLFNDAAKWLETEWDFYIWDVRDGRFHPNSRSAKDYSDEHAERSYNYSKVKPHSGPIGRENPAFDREALKNPQFDYIGRKRVDGLIEEHVLKSKNIAPCITTLGMRNYIFSYLGSKMKDDETFRQNLSRYVYDSGVEDVEKVGGLFTKMPTETATKKENE
jgi:hypothetical protein